MTNKYFEVRDPYYALIKAENEVVAKNFYVKAVSDFEGVNPFEQIKEVPADYAIVRTSRVLGEDGQELMPIDEVLEMLRSDEATVLIFDGSL